MTYLMNIELLNKNEIKLEIIHLDAIHCCIYVDPNFSHWFDWDAIVFVTNNHLPFWLTYKMEEVSIFL